MTENGLTAEAPTPRRYSQALQDDRKVFGTPVSINRRSSAKKHFSVEVAEAEDSRSPSPRRELNLMLQDVTGLAQVHNGGFDFSRLAKNAASPCHRAEPQTTFWSRGVTAVSLAGVAGGAVLLCIGLMMHFDVL